MKVMTRRFFRLFNARDAKAEASSEADADAISNGASIKQEPAGRHADSKKNEPYGVLVTAGLIVLLVGMLVCLWALFISGPARLHDESQQKTIEAIHQTVPDITDLSEHKFEYVTWQGRTDDTLYWFDALGGMVTSRPLGELDYQAARQKAADLYSMEADVVFLAYGYSAPVYQLENDGQILMLDFDSLEWVYERSRLDAQSQ